MGARAGAREVVRKALYRVAGNRDSMETNQERPDADHPGCRDCSIHHCPTTPDREDDPPLSGWRLALSAMGLFLAPAVLAILASLCYADSRLGQLLGATAGLALGMAASVVLVKLLHRLDIRKAKSATRKRA
jgi:hypothetical protein